MNKKHIVIAGVFLSLVMLTMTFLLAPKPAARSLSKEEAINTVIASHPELASYRTTSLPPSTIEAEEGVGGWHTAFIQSGSGVSGILNAKCYQVTDERKVIVVGEYVRQGDKPAFGVALETCQPIFKDEALPPPPITREPATVTPPSSQGHVLLYGNVTLKLNQVATFKNISIRPLAIVEDSRCPIDVQCIQAGTVRVNVEVSSGMGKSVSILKLGQVFTTEGEAITLVSVMPDKNSKLTFTEKDYRFVFNVLPQGNAKASDPKARCYVGGCSGQLCSETPDTVSTCEYSETYACYKTATCTRQTNGQCGWTKTPELTACLTNSHTTI